MTSQYRLVFCCVLGVVVLLGAAGIGLGAPWPDSLNYAVGWSTADEAPIQLGASVQGMFTEHWGAKIGGWWVTGGNKGLAFVGDAYVNYMGDPLYVAVGRKFVPFGPAGLLVSPGIGGGEAQYHQDRITLQVLDGTLQFTPVVGWTRFTFSGARALADKPVRAARVAVELTDPSSDRHTTLGGNWLDVEDDTGVSADLSADVNAWLTLFGESARFGDENAYAYGIRITNQNTCANPSRYTSATVYGRHVPIGFVPAAVGASAYFENQTGLAVGVYHQINATYAVGAFGDRHDAIVSLLGYVPLH